MILRVAWAAALLVALPACTANEPGNDQPPTSQRAAPAPSATTGTPSPRPSPATPPAVTPPPATKPGQEPSRSPAVSPTAPADRRGDLVRGYRTLVGTIEAAGPCPVLRVGGERWSLLGDRTRGVVAGARFEVRGTVTTPPRGCHTTRALTVSQVIRR
jgi:hypothetical protein